MEPITLSADRPALQYTLGGEPRRWEYDVVTLKLECERLEESHKHAGKPTASMLEQFSAYLAAAGLEGCNSDISLRVWSLVTVQFGKLAASIAAQVSKLD